MKLTAYFLSVSTLVILSIATIKGEMAEHIGREDELGLSNHDSSFDHPAGPCELCFKCRTFAATMTGVLAPSVARVCDRVHCHNCANHLVGGDVEMSDDQHCDMCMKCGAMGKSMASTMLAGDIAGLCKYVHCKNCADILVASVSTAEHGDPCGMCHACGILNDQVEGTPIGESFVSTCYYKHCYECGKKLVADFLG